MSDLTLVGKSSLNVITIDLLCHNEILQLWKIYQCWVNGTDR